MQITWFKSFIRYNSYDPDDTYATSDQCSKPKPKSHIILAYDTLPGWWSDDRIKPILQTKSEFPFHIDQSVWVMLLIYFTRCFGHNHCATVGNANDDSFEAQIIFRECEIYTEMIHLRLIVGGWMVCSLFIVHDMGYIFNVCGVLSIQFIISPKTTKIQKNFHHDKKMK